MMSEDLIKDLQNPNWEKRFFALKQAGKSGDKSLLPTVIALLNDGKAKVRRMAAWAAGELGDGSISETLIVAMADPDDWVRVTIVESLGKIGDQRMSLIISQFLENEEDEKVRATLLKVLGTLGDKKMIPIVSQYLNDKDNRVIANAIEALGRLCPGEATVPDSILDFIKHNDNRIKANTAKALWDMGQEDEAFTILLEMLRSKNITMIASAAYMLGEIRSKRALLPLIETLTNDTWIVRKNVLMALKKQVNFEMDLIIKATDHPDPRIRTGAVWVLGHEAQNPKARKALLYALQDDDGEVRSKAEEALDKFSDWKN
ncbi:HEAT repeat domain-containing protein [Candidatus Riflebacteria bacterium]